MADKKVPGKEQRRARRIARHCHLQTRQVNPPGKFNDWEVSTVRNISAVGVMFYSMRHYEIGSELEVIVKDATLLDEEVKLCGTVVRSKPAPSLIDIVGAVLIDLNEIAVDFTKVDKKTKDSLHKAVERFSQDIT